METGGRGSVEEVVDVVALLQQIYNAVDGLELSLDNIDVNTLNVDMNTDELEARIGEISATPTANTLQDRLRLIKLDLAAIDANTDQLEVKLDSIITRLDVNLSTRASETTLAAIKAQTDKLAFVTDKLKVDASFTGDSSFGDNATTVTVNKSFTSVLMKAANINRKELILHNATNRICWVTFNSPAVVGKGIRVNRKATIFFDRARTAVYGIWELGGGLNGGMEVTEVII